MAQLPMLLPPARPLVLCGPSGVGKSYVLQALLRAAPHQLAFSVSHTSRPPRGAERDGVEYHFRRVAEIEALAAAGKMIECDRIHGQLYGTSVRAVREVHAAGRVCVMDMSIGGAVQFAALCASQLQQAAEAAGTAGTDGRGEEGCSPAAAADPPLPLPFCVHLRPPTMHALEERLRHRATEGAEQQAARLASAVRTVHPPSAALIRRCKRPRQVCACTP